MLLAIPQRADASPAGTQSYQVSPQQISQQAVALQYAGDAFRRAGISRIAIPLPTVHEKPPVLRTCSRKRRIDRTVEASRQDAPPKTQSNSEATAMRPYVR